MYKLLYFLIRKIILILLINKLKKIIRIGNPSVSYGFQIRINAKHYKCQTKKRGVDEGTYDKWDDNVYGGSSGTHWQHDADGGTNGGLLMTLK